MLKEFLPFLFLILSLPAWGASSLSMKEEAIYSELKNLCSYNDKIIFVGHFYNKAVESVRKEVELTVENLTTRFIRNRSTTGAQSMYMHDFINSDVFISTMKECFPAESERNQVVFLTLWADVAGQLTGAAQVYVSFWGSIKTIRILGKGLFQAFTRSLTRLNGVAPSISEAQFASYFGWAATVLPVGYIVGSTRSEKTPPIDVSTELVKMQLDRVQQKVEVLLVRQNETIRTGRNFCIYNDLAYNLGQNYFSILREMKQRGVDLKVFGDNRDFRRKVLSLKPCSTYLNSTL